MHVIDGQIQDKPVLDVAVANSIERGLLGIAIAKQPDGKTYVFLSYTESGDDVDGSDAEDNVDPSGNRLYRYEYVDGQLENPTLLLDFLQYQIMVEQSTMVVKSGLVQIIMSTM